MAASHSHACSGLLTGNGQESYVQSAARSRNRRKFRRSTGKLLEALG